MVLTTTRPVAAFLDVAVVDSRATTDLVAREAAVEVSPTVDAAALLADAAAFRPPMHELPSRHK